MSTTPADPKESSASESNDGRPGFDLRMESAAVGNAQDFYRFRGCHREAIKPLGKERIDHKPGCPNAGEGA